VPQVEIMPVKQILVVRMLACILQTCTSVPVETSCLLCGRSALLNVASLTAYFRKLSAVIITCTMHKQMHTRLTVHYTVPYLSLLHVSTPTRRPQGDSFNAVMF
jgi:hypothetical protein